MVLVKSQTIGTAVSTVSVTDAFSSTYDNYLITLSGGVGSTGQLISFRLGSTSANYYWAGVYLTYGSTVSVNALNNGGEFRFGLSTTNNNIGAVFVNSPNLAKNTNFSNVGFGGIAGDGAYVASGYLNDSTQYTAFTLLVSGTMTGGEIRVYGFRK
jgi:hypothetical protein